MPIAAVQSPEHGDLARFVCKVRNRLYWEWITRTRPSFATSAYGPRFLLNPDDITFRLYVCGFYGRFLADRLSGYDRPFAFLDVGANQGLYTTIAAANPLCRRVWAFEPAGHTFSLLQRNVAANAGHQKVELLRHAVSAQTGVSTIHMKPGHSGGASLSVAHEGATQETISCLSAADLDPLLRIEPDIDVLVKVDTEGHESVVFKELRKLSLWPRVRFVFFEVNESWVEGDALLDTLRQDGFRETWRTGQGLSHFDVAMERR